MNAAFLLVTTAWLAGADAPPPSAPAAPAATSSWSGGCDACCESHGSRWKKLFSHKHEDCCDPCAKPACPKPSCDPCAKESHHLKGLFHKSADCCDTCAKPTYKPAPAFSGGCNACCEDKPSCWEKLKARLHRSDCCDPCASGTTTSAVPAKMPEPIKAPKDAGPAKKLPEGGKEVRIIETNDVKPASASEPVEKETKSPFEISRRYESRVGFAPDYSWLTGQLFYVHADGGLWVLRYAPLSTEDANGGGVVIARDLPMDSYRDGDLVTVHGALLGQKSSIFLGGPLYRGKTIELVERQK
ncbi:MAG TPA: hypothetical protein VGZ25_14775 [Gemmataceae bacterium]|nr:hypothetical protein [Gemmataceae bacterium]